MKLWWFLSGLSGIVGTVIFSLLFPGNENLGWAFGLSATSSTLTTVSSLLIAGSRVFHKDSLTSAIADSTVAGTSAADDGHLAPPGIPLQNFQATAYPERYLSEFPHSSSATSSRSADAVETSSDVHAQYVQPADGAPPFYVMGGHVVPPSAPPFTGDSGRDPFGSFTPVVPSAPPLEDVLYWDSVCYCGFVTCLQQLLVTWLLGITHVGLWTTVKQLDCACKYWKSPGADQMLRSLKDISN